MAVIDKKLYLLTMPKAMSRTNALPLDASSVWYAYADMEAYAKNNPTAYVGQVLSLVDEANNSATAYVIVDTEGTLREVGSATHGDDKTITLDPATGILGLKNWNKKYYKWVAATETTDGYYEEVEVNGEENVWAAGLEPKVVNDGTGFELAWFEPNTSTMEGVESSISTIQTSVTNLTNAIGTADDSPETDTVYGAINDIKQQNAATIETLKTMLPLAGGTMTGDIILADGSKVLSEKEINLKITSAVETAGHLKRIIVESLPTIEDADIEAIYMVFDPLAFDNNVYDEYMIIQGNWEKIGDTQVDLANYLQKVENPTNGALTMLNANGELVDTKIAAQAVEEHLNDENIHITSDERAEWNANTEAIAALVKISQEDANKLAALPAITGIGANLELTEEGILNAAAAQYELPAATTEALGGVKVGTGLAIDTDGLLSVKVSAANGLSMGENGLELALANENTAGALSAELFVKINNLMENGQPNVVEGAVLGANNVVAAINENKQIVLPFAATNTPGLVTSGTEVAVDSITGEMSVKQVSTDKLYVPEGSELVLCGGSSDY